MSVHEMTSKCINIDFRFNVPCTLFRQKGAQILCFRGNFYCSVNPNLVWSYGYDNQTKNWSDAYHNGVNVWLYYYETGVDKWIEYYDKMYK